MKSGTDGWGVGVRGEKEGRGEDLGFRCVHSCVQEGGWKVSGARVCLCVVCDFTFG